jgi:RimJ/RimL family protein N-acetyltransferase
VPKIVAPAVSRNAMAAREQPVLVTGELLLRPWTSTDVPGIVAAYADSHIRRWHARDMNDAEAAQWVTNANSCWTTETGASWAVTSRTGKLVGRMSLRTVDLEEGLADIGYWVVPSARGRGVASEALVLVSDWAIDELGLHRLELEHSTRNESSCRVAQRAGYLSEGTKRSSALHEDGWHDMHLHARLAQSR